MIRLALILCLLFPGIADAQGLILGRGTALKTNLVAYWTMDESSGTRSDSHTNSLDLTDNNTVGSTTGKISNAADCIQANSEYLNRTEATDALLEPGDQDWTVALWINPDVIDSNTAKAVHHSGFGSQGGYEFQFNSGFGCSGCGFSTRWRFNNTTVGTRMGDASNVISTGSWHFLVMWHDATANTVNISLNDATPLSTSYSGGISSNTTDFTICSEDAGSADFFDGKIDELGVWDRVLTAAEITWLYNSGSGRTYSDF